MTSVITRRAAALAALAVLAVVLVAPADAVRRRDLDPIEGAPEEEEFRELRIAPPPYPLDADLIEFTPTGQSRNRFYVDGTTLSVGKDGLIRFVLVVRTPAKAENVTFSGVNCKTKEWKDFAYARANREWVLYEQAQWRQIQASRTNNYRATLFDEFFCYGGLKSGAPLGDAKTIVRNLKNPAVPDARTPRKFNQFQQQ